MTDHRTNLERMADGYITAALWADCMPACTCGLQAVDPAGEDTGHDPDCPAGPYMETGGLERLDVRDVDRAYVVALCEAFAAAAGDDLDLFADLRDTRGDYDPWECVGHDLRLTSGGHGTGFWDREPDPDRAPSGTTVEQWRELDSAFLLARDRLSDLARRAPFSRYSGGDVWQIDEDTAHLDHWPLDPDAAPGDRWTPPAACPACGSEVAIPQSYGPWDYACGLCKTMFDAPAASDSTPDTNGASHA